MDRTLYKTNGLKATFLHKELNSKPQNKVIFLAVSKDYQLPTAMIDHVTKGESRTLHILIRQ